MKIATFLIQNLKSAKELILVTCQNLEEQINHFNPDFMEQYLQVILNMQELFCFQNLLNNLGEFLLMILKQQ